MLQSIWTYRLARAILSAVFLYAGMSKILNTAAFASVISGYGLAPQWFLPLLAVVIPLLEILAAVGLLLDIKGSLAVLTVLTLLFMLVLWHGIRLGLDVDCGCYAPGDPEGEAYHSLGNALLRDAGLLFLCAGCYWWRWRNTPNLVALWPGGTGGRLRPSTVCPNHSPQTNDGETKCAE